MDFIELVNNLNNRLEVLNAETSKFQLDKIICSHPLKTTILGYAPSILNDQTLAPTDLRIPILSNMTNRHIIYWINRKYMDALNHLSQGKRLDYSTHLVRLRIAACMATHISNGLTNEEKEEWRQHICNVFYNRNLVMVNYYFEEMERLPF